MEKIDILALAAHPDDTELGCGGTLAKLSRLGYKIGVVDFTQGEMGSRGTPEKRLEESGKAAEIIGLNIRENLGLPDTKLENKPAFRERIIKVVRKYRPHICLVGPPDDRHPDHGDATRLAIDALYYSGLSKLETTGADGNPQERWRPSHILHYMQDRPFEPDLVFDITDTFETKMEAVLAFDSQFNVEDPGDEPETYVSSKRFFKNLEAKARHYGHMIGVTYGEPFLYHHGPVPFNSFDLLMDMNPER
ncbi:MAG: bacillithiol biosynthesis deacetylase BshB1 [Balneolaceae bacterium]|nr:bacillithiol biosynthesis deacetylase BshB1 [Balneolaceae bacterium]